MMYLSNSPAKSRLIADRFVSEFGSEPLIVRSPGRVNLIGDHTDYNEGFVLPAAIDKSIFIAIQRNNSHTINAISFDLNESAQISINHSNTESTHWAKYINGVKIELQTLGYVISGFDMVFGGDIPIGAGLSSSAALEGGLLVALDALFDLNLTRKQMARIGQKTEHNHVGVQCGIMDQYVNLLGEANSVLRLDCRSIEHQSFPFENSDMKIVLCNTMVTHKLADSEYNVRRKQCESGVQCLRKHYPNIKNLRDVSLEMLSKHQLEMDEVVYRRCTFVLEENQRVLDACEDLQNSDFKSFGEKMFLSHQGLSKEYEVSCSELDTLVDIAKDQKGLFGARMMGGGFGGCTINLVEKNHLLDFTTNVKSRYLQTFGVEPEIYLTEINAGASVLNEIVESLKNEE